MAYDYVPCGLYHGFDRAEVLAELAKVDASIKAGAPGAGQIISASENGKSVSFAAPSQANGDTMSSLRSQKAELMTALAFVDDDYTVTTNTAVARFC